ncbi:MAG: hypothetical protein QW328_04735 [Nitrososphaerota archaeon]
MLIYVDVLRSWLEKGMFRVDTGGISKVLAVIILSAIAVSLAIMVAFWSEAFVSLFTGQRENVQIFMTASFDASSGGYVIEATVKNLGTKDVVIDQFLINGKAFWEGDVKMIRFEQEGVVQDVPLSFKLAPGKGATIQLHLGDSWKPGMMLEVRVRTQRGNEFFMITNLP